MKNIVVLMVMMYGCFGCIYNDDCNINYIIDIPIEIIPDSNTYNIGDTLHISMNIDNQSIYDKHGDRYVSIPNFDPNAWFLMPLLDTFPVKDGFLENELIIDQKFEIRYIPVETLTIGIFFLGIDTSEASSHLDFKIVLKKSGTYCLYAASALYYSDQVNPVMFEERCGLSRGGILDAEFSYINDNNFDLLSANNLDVENQYWKGSEGQRRRSSPYYFKVEE